MPYRALRCILCKEDDKWYSELYTEQGKRNMIKHMDEVHDVIYTMEVFADDER